MTLDAITPLPETTLARLYNQVAGVFSFDGWAYLGIAFVMLFVLAYILFYYFKYPTQKRIAFISSLVAISLATVFILFAFLRYQDYKADQPAIIFAQEINVKAEPNNRSDVAFTLHEGTKVNVLEEFDSWKKIQLPDGQVGWVPQNTLRLLKDF